MEEKFREIVIKLANNAPNKPLSETQNSFIHDQFNQFLSVLHRTPDHPPYAWMIQRALQGLNEKGGSSEESISDFIRKEYHDLPWSHFTLLKHHLQALSECGDIILTPRQHYLIAGADSTRNSGKRGRRKSRKKRDWNVKRRKQRKKDIDKENLLQKEDQTPEKQNLMLEGLKQKDKEAEVRNDTLELYILVENGEQIEGDQTEIPTPERPPGFESAVLAESSHTPVCYRESPSHTMYPTRSPPDVVVSAAEGLSGQQEQIRVLNVYDQLNHEEGQMILSVHGAPEPSVDKTLQDVQPMTTIHGINLQETNNEECLAMPSQASPIEELRSQKKTSEFELKKDAAAIFETEPVYSTGGKRVTRILLKYQKRQPTIKAAKQKNLSCTIQVIKDELLQEQGLSSTDEPQEGKSGAANRSEDQGLPIVAIKPSCEEPCCPQEIIEAPDSCPPASPILQHQPHEILEPNEVQEMEPGTSDISDHQELPIPKPFKLEGRDIEESFPISSLQCQGKHLREQLSNRKRPRLENHAPLESGRLTRKRAKLYSQEERNSGQLKVSLASTVVLKRPNSRTEKLLTQEKPSFRVLRPRPLKLEQPDALIAAKSSPSQQPKQRGRPPKPKSDNGVTNDNVVPDPKRRGRPPKYKPGDHTVTNKKLLSGTQQDTPRNLRRGRSQKTLEGE